MHICARNPRLWKLSGRDNRKQQECGESVWVFLCGCHARLKKRQRFDRGAHYTPISLPVGEWRGMWRLCVLLTEFSFSSMTLDLPSSRYQIERTCQGALGCWKTDYSNECFDFYLVSSFPSVVLQGVLDKLYSAGDLSDVDLKSKKSLFFSDGGRTLLLRIPRLLVAIQRGRRSSFVFI